MIEIPTVTTLSETWERYRPTCIEERIEAGVLLFALASLTYALYHLKDIEIDFSKH